MATVARFAAGSRRLATRRRTIDPGWSATRKLVTWLVVDDKSRLHSQLGSDSNRLFSPVDAGLKRMKPQFLFGFRILGRLH